MGKIRRLAQKSGLWPDVADYFVGRLLTTVENI